MTQALDTPRGSHIPARERSRHLPFGLLKELERPEHVVRDLGPNWFAAVMGTGIVANAAATLPLRVPGLRVFATAVWILAAVALIALTAAWAVHWTRYRDRARAHAANPVMAQFWGAPAMALMTVGTGALLLGGGLIGTAAAAGADWVLWGAGTALGLVTAVWIPYLMMTRHDTGPDAAFGGWLMPVVPPMVSAASGALLIPHLPPGQGRLTLLLACYAMFGISLFASVIIITQLWSRLVLYKTLPAAMVPTLWIVLGPLGQSVTAAGNLGTAAAHVLPAPYAAGAAVFALLYGVPALGVRHDVAGAGRGHHDPYRPARPALHADVVELHLPRRDLRDRHHRAGRPQSRRRAGRSLGHPLRPAAGQLADRRRPHRPRHRDRPPAGAHGSRRPACRVTGTACFPEVRPDRA